MLVTSIQCFGNAIIVASKLSRVAGLPITPTPSISNFMSIRNFNSIVTSITSFSFNTWRIGDANGQCGADNVSHSSHTDNVNLFASGMCCDSTFYFSGNGYGLYLVRDEKTVGAGVVFPIVLTLIVFKVIFCLLLSLLLQISLVEIDTGTKYYKYKIVKVIKLIVLFDFMMMKNHKLSNFCLFCFLFCFSFFFLFSLVQG